MGSLCGRRAAAGTEEPPEETLLQLRELRHHEAIVALIRDRPEARRRADAANITLEADLAYHVGELERGARATARVYSWALEQLHVEARDGGVPRSADRAATPRQRQR